MNVKRDTIQCSFQCIAIPNLFVCKMLNDLLPCHMLWPKSSLFHKGCSKQSFFFNSTSAFSTQNLLSNTNTFPVAQTGLVNPRRIPQVLPWSSNSLLPKFAGRSFPSRKSMAQMMSESAHPALWYSLPNGHGLQGTYINPGHVYSFTHLDMLLSMQWIIADEN